MFPSTTHSSGELGVWCGGGSGKLRFEGCGSSYSIRSLDSLERDLSELETEKQRES